MAMDPVRKADWLTRLRSGQYQQGYNELRSADGKFCCLGVACEAAVEAGVTDYWEGSDYRVYGEPVDGESYTEYADAQGDQSWSTLPLAVQEWLGLDGEDGRDPFVRIPADHPKAHRLDVSRERLSFLNDAGFTFEEIADLIEGQF